MDLIRQKSFSFLKKCFKDFSDVIYTTGKNELIRWLDRNTKVLDFSSPQKWEVKASSL